MTTINRFTAGFYGFRDEYAREIANGRNPGCLCGRDGHQTEASAQACLERQRKILGRTGRSVGHMTIFLNGQRI